MGLIGEFTSDFDFREPRVMVTDKNAIIENVKNIVMLSETSVTVFTGRKYVTVNGWGFVIKEIFEGRLLIEGQIQSIEFLGTSDQDKDRGGQDREAAGSGPSKRP